MRTAGWTRGDLLVAGGTAVALAAVAETVRSLYERFALDLSGLSAVERAGVALWDFRPLAPGVFAAGALAVLAGLGEPPGRLAERAGPARPLAAALLAAYAALGLAVLATAVWIAAKGAVGGRDELGFLFTGGERAVTLATQLLAWGPLVALFALLALRATEPEEPAEELRDERPRVSAEMDALWRDRLAFGPKRELARNLLRRIRALEEAGDDESARALAEEMRRL
jgi:hypothetical protein